MLREKGSWRTPAERGSIAVPTLQPDPGNAHYPTVYFSRRQSGIFYAKSNAVPKGCPKQPHDPSPYWEGMRRIGERSL